MSRWLSKGERGKRDKKVIELYQQGFAYTVICQRLGFSGKSGAIGAILVAHGITRDRRLSKEERDERDRRVLELYRQGVSCAEIRLKYKVNVSLVLKQCGLKADRR